MELFENKKSRPVWVSFENHSGEKGCGGLKNKGAKGLADTVLAGEVLTLCDIAGEGVVRRIWITIDEKTPETLSGVILRMYWDGSDTPSVEVPLGNFFCMNLGQMYTFDSELFSSPEGRSFCCFIPMPFRKGVRITAENTMSKQISCFFFDVDLTMEAVGDEAMYFHAESRDATNRLGEDIEMLNVSGTGRFLGVSAGVTVDTDKYGSLWWGEGEVKLYLDGDTDYPSLCGTGSEDYIGTAWGQGCFANRTQGCLECGNGRAAWYRYHTVDPIFFNDGCRVTIQTIGGAFWRDVRKVIENGVEAKPVPAINEAATPDDAWVNFYRCDRYRTTAYYYLK